VLFEEDIESASEEDTRELEKDIIAIDYQDEIVVLHMRLVVQEVEHASNLSCMGVFFLMVPLVFVSKVDQSGRRVVENECRMEGLAKIRVRLRRRNDEMKSSIGRWFYSGPIFTQVRGFQCIVREVFMPW
jgi:hypothetical protein